MRTRWIATMALVAALAVVGAACGDAGSEGTDPAPPATATTQPAPATTTAPTTTEPTATTVAPTTTAAPPTTVAPTTTSTSPSTTTTAPGLPGTVWEHGPEAGAQLGVVGVAFDDVLNVRAGPGADQRIVTTLEPQAIGVAATGQARQLPSRAIWVEVTANGATGWANQAFLSRQADTVDSTADFVELLGERPEAPTMLELGRILADAIASVDPASKIVVVVAPQGEHDLGEVVYDVLGFGDDSVGGTRLHVFGRPSDDRQSFSLLSVEETLFCSRGVAAGICV